MSELGPRAREILRSARELNRPTDADRERIESALRERLGAALLLSEASKAPLAVRPRWPFVTSLVVGGGLFLATRHEPVNASAPQAVVTAVIATSSALPPASAVEPPSLDAPKPAALVSADRATPSAR